MNYPEFYQLAWILYVIFSASQFVLLWWVLAKIPTSAKRAILMLYMVLAWVPVQVEATEEVWCSALIAVLMGLWMDGHAVMLKGIAPLLAAFAVSLFALATQAFFVRAKDR